MESVQAPISIGDTALKPACGIHTFSHGAMGTGFEVYISGVSDTYAQQSAQAGFAELDRLELELSRFIENSDVSRINNFAGKGPIEIGADTFESLETALRLFRQTDGAFDITIGALRDCWQDKNGTLLNPSREQIELAGRCTGSNLIRLDSQRHTAQILAEGVNIDLGGIGKGYALDKMAEVFKQWGISSALINGGCSSVLALNPVHKQKGWPLSFSNMSAPKQILRRVYLNNCALGSSSLEYGPHIFDSRMARPAERTSRAVWVRSADAASADALSTAFMVMSIDEINEYCKKNTKVSAIAAIPKGDKCTDVQLLTFGNWNTDTPVDT
ncbi:MAG: FAD:protein FMN transferase [Sedimentisphaerales bacterium]|nr:FAD:protein FMN transferase [Sedimentisphaerales bacterium]